MFQITLKREHQGMAVHNACAGRVQRAHAVQSGLECQRLCTAEPLQISHCVGPRPLLNGFKAGELGRRGRDQQLAAATVGHTPLRAIGVKQRFTLHTQPGLQRASRVINARMDHLAVARTGARANGIGSLHHDHLAPSQGQRACHGEAHHTSADHDTIHGFCHAFAFRSARTRRAH